MWSLARCSVYRSDTSIQQRSDLPLVTDLQTHESLRSFKPTLKLVQASALSFLSLPCLADLPRLKLGLSIPYLVWDPILGGRIPWGYRRLSRRRHGAKGRIGTGLVLGAPIAGATLTTLAAWSTARRISAPGPRERKFVTPWELGVPHRGRPALGRLVASFSAGKEDGDCPPRPQGSKASLRGDSSGSLEERSKRTPLRPPRAGLLRGKIHLPGSLRVDRYFCGHKVRDLQSRRSANRPHRLLDGRRGRPDQRIQGRACRGGGGRLTLCRRAGVGAGPTEEANMSSV